MLKLFVNDTFGIIPNLEHLQPYFDHLKVSDDDLDVLELHLTSNLEIENLYSVESLSMTNSVLLIGVTTNRGPLSVQIHRCGNETQYFVCAPRTTTYDIVYTSQHPVIPIPDTDLPPAQ